MKIYKTKQSFRIYERNGLENTEIFGLSFIDEGLFCIELANVGLTAHIQSAQTARIDIEQTARIDIEETARIEWTWSSVRSLLAVEMEADNFIAVLLRGCAYLVQLVFPS